MRLEAWLACDLPPNEALEQQERVLQVVAALAKLPAAQREALIMHNWNGWPLAKIAEHMGRSRAAVAGLIKRGVRQLRQEIGPMEASHAGHRR